MESLPSLEVVMQALQVLYHGENTDSKEKASLWLGELQKSTFAWQIADQLLLLNHNVESCYFAAQTMRAKIQFSFHELPQSSHESLKDSLLNHCTKITLDTPQVIITQLCLALADLSLHLTTWENPVIDLINRFGVVENNWTFLLEVLSLIPEEVGCRSMRLSPERINDVVQKLKTASPVLIQFISTVIAQKKDERSAKQVIRLLSSWIKTSSLPCNLVISNNLLELPFSVLSGETSPHSLHKAASDCICNSLLCLEEMSQLEHGGTNEERNNLSHLLYNGVCALSPVFLKLCQTSPEDHERLMNFSRIFTDTCEVFLPNVMCSPNEGFGHLKIFELVLSCLNCNGFEIAQITFTFWNRFAEVVYDNQHLKNQFGPYVLQLIRSLMSHLKLLLSYETIQDCPDDFLEFRYECQELISDVAFMICPEELFNEMSEAVKHYSASWPEFEVGIFIMAALARHLHEAETSSRGVCELLDLIICARDMNECVKHSCIKLIGELRWWIDIHPVYIEPCLRFLMSNLQSNHLATLASESFQSLCHCSSSHMSPLFDKLLQILQSIDSCCVSNEAIISILKGLAGILGRMSSIEVIEKTKELCALQLIPLNHILDNDITVVLGHKESDPSIWLDRLAAIFSHLDSAIKNGDAHPCQKAVEQVWPVLTKVFLKCAKDGKIIERCCRCVRFVVRCLGRSAVFLLEPIVVQMVNLYQTHPHSCCIYLGGILVDEFGVDARHHALLIRMLESFCPLTFELLADTSGLRNHPDLVDDLFRLSFRFMQRAPQPFISCSCTKKLLACAAYSCCLDHKDANESACLFLIEFFKSHNSLQMSECGREMRDLLLAGGQEIMNHIIKASLFCLPHFMIHKIADLLHEIFTSNNEMARFWLEQTLGALPRHSATGKQMITEQQLSQFLYDVSSANDQKKVYKSLQHLIRLFK